MKSPLTWTRRETLRKSIGATGGLVFGSLLSGAVAAERGGSAFADPDGEDFEEGDEFVVEELVEDYLVDIEPSCKTGATPKAYQVYEVEHFRDGTSIGTGLIAILPARGFEPGPDRYEVVHVKQDCTPFAESSDDGIKFSFKPAN